MEREKKRKRHSAHSSCNSKEREITLIIEIVEGEQRRRRFDQKCAQGHQLKQYAVICPEAKGRNSEYCLAYKSDMSWQRYEMNPNLKGFLCKF